MNHCISPFIKIAIGTLAILLNPCVNADRIWEFKDGTKEELRFFNVEEGLRSQIVKFVHKEKGFIDCPIGELADKEVVLLKNHIASKKELEAKEKWRLKNGETITAKSAGSATSYSSDPKKPFHVVKLRSEEGFIHRVDAYFLMKEDSNVILNYLKSNPNDPRQDLTVFKLSKFHISHKQNEQTILLKPIALIDTKKEIIVHSINKQRDHIKNSLSKFEPETIKKILRTFGIRLFQRDYHYSNRVDNYNIVKIAEHEGYWQFLNFRKSGPEKVCRCLNKKGEILEVSESKLAKANFDLFQKQLNPKPEAVPIETFPPLNSTNHNIIPTERRYTPKETYYFFSYFGDKQYFYQKEELGTHLKRRSGSEFFEGHPFTQKGPYFPYRNYKKSRTRVSNDTVRKKAKSVFNKRHSLYKNDLGKIDFSIPKKAF